MNAFAQSLMDKSLDFAIEVVALARWLSEDCREFVISRQVLKSGTSIGANVREAQYAQSEADFLSKLSIALKEGAETQYWLDVLFRSKLIDRLRYEPLRLSCDNLVGLLVNVTKKCKLKQGKIP